MIIKLEDRKIVKIELIKRKYKFVGIFEKLKDIEMNNFISIFK